MNGENLVQILKAVETMRSGNPAEIMKLLPIEGNKQVSELMKLLPKMMGNSSIFPQSMNARKGRDAEIFRVANIGTIGKGK